MQNLFQIYSNLVVLAFVVAALLRVVAIYSVGKFGELHCQLSWIDAEGVLINGSVLAFVFCAFGAVYLERTAR